MSRSNYVDEIEDHARYICWRGAVASALRGARGQALLRDLLVALDAMPDKRLAPEYLVNPSGEFCALGVLGHARGLDLSKIDPENSREVAKAFNVAPAMVREIVFENDEALGYLGTERDRWVHMRAWVAGNIKEPGPLDKAEGMR